MCWLIVNDLDNISKIAISDLGTLKEKLELKKEVLRYSYKKFSRRKNTVHGIYNNYIKRKKVSKNHQKGHQNLPPNHQKTITF